MYAKKYTFSQLQKSDLQRHIGEVVGTRVSC